MTRNEMMNLIETMNNYDELAAKVKSKADAIRTSIKEEMERQAVEELTCGQYIIRYTSVISNRFDSIFHLDHLTLRQLSINGDVNIFRKTLNYLMALRQRRASLKHDK